MFTGVPAILLLLPAFAVVLILTISLPNRNKRSAPNRPRPLRMTEPNQRSWYTHENQTDEFHKKHAA